MGDEGAAAALVARFAEFADQPALIREGASATYRQLAEAVSASRDLLARERVGAGTVALLRADYSLEGVAMLLALATRGAVAVPVTVTTPREVSERASESQADLEISFDAGAPQLAWRSAGEKHPFLKQLAQAGRAGLVLFSSGATGAPKAMLLDLDRLIASYADRKARAMRLLVFLLFDHIGGLNTLFGALAGGSTLVIPTSRDPERVAQLIEAHRVFLLPASPTFLNLLLVSGALQRHDLGSLRMITYGTEPMPEALLTRLRAALPRARFMQTFGTSETGIVRTVPRSADSLFFKIDDPNVEHRVVDGELWLRSQTQALGYLNHSMESFVEGGWYRTGDLVEATADGFIRIKGRLNAMINVGGQKVSPEEVEAAIMELAEVGDCRVFGAPSPVTGSIVVADVVPAPGCALDPKALRSLIRRHCGERLDAHKVPARVSVVQDIGHTHTFKKRRGAG